MSTPASIPVREVTNHESIDCPYCSHQISPSIESAEETGWVFDRDRDVCEHTLFVATSEGGFEYRAPRYSAFMGLPADQDPTPELPPSPDDPEDTLTWNEFTSLPTVPRAEKILSFDGHIDLYVGFAPIQHN
jgi:hypothetical protein